MPRVLEEDLEILPFCELHLQKCVKFEKKIPMKFFVTSLSNIQEKLRHQFMFFSVCRHVVQLVVIWAVSGLLALPEAMVLHAVSSFKDQPCVR